MTKEKNLKWHKGPPPHVGLWLASVGKHNIWRWWNGVAWSHQVSCDSSISTVINLSKGHGPYHVQPLIKWSDYYPEDAIVPRIDPRKGGKE